MGWAQWQGSLSLSAAVTQSRANTLGTAERDGAKVANAIRYTMQIWSAVWGQGHTDHSQPWALPLLYGHAVKTQTQSPAVTSSEHVLSASCRTQADRALQWVISLFFSWDRKCSSLGWFWAAPLKKQICHMLVSAENAQGLRNPGVCWEPRIQEWSTWVEPYFQWSKGGLVHSPGPTPPLALSCNL